MALSHSGYNYEGSSLHQDILVSPFALEIVTHKFFGVIGETHLVDATGGRDLQLSYTLSGYLTSALLKAALNRISDKAGTLTGTLSVTGSRTESYAQCTFLGYEMSSDSFYDGGGNHYWIADIVLRWRQRSR